MHGVNNEGKIPGFMSIFVSVWTLCIYPTQLTCFSPITQKKSLDCCSTNVFVSNYFWFTFTSSRLFHSKWLRKRETLHNKHTYTIYGIWYMYIMVYWYTVPYGIPYGIASYTGIPYHLYTINVWYTNGIPYIYGIYHTYTINVWACTIYHTFPTSSTNKHV